MKKDRTEGDPSDSRDIVRALLDSSSTSVGGWSYTDLTALLEHQLQTPLRLEAERLISYGKVPSQAGELLLAWGPDATFLDVLNTGTAGDGVLRMIKEYAKDSVASDDVLPGEIGRFLYIASILRAQSAGDDSFTTLDNASVEREARRCLTFTWLPDSARDLLRHGLSGLHGA